MQDAEIQTAGRADRLTHALLRDGERCVWCGRPLPVGHRDASLEHVVPKLKGGPAWPENEVAACKPCNRRRGHTAPDRWLAECEERGLEPDRERICERLLALDGAISRRGGQRKARPYLAGQLRRLALV